MVRDIAFSFRLGKISDIRAILSTLLFLSVQALAGQDLLFRIHVVDPLHENVKAARIDLISGRDSRTAFADVNGVATFVNLNSGTSNIRIAAYGFTTWVRDQDIKVQQDRPLLVTLKPAVLSCDPHFSIEYDNRPGSLVRGVVIDSKSGNGIRGIKIQLRLPDGKKPLVTLRSQKKGLFEIPKIAPGRYRLRITDDIGYFNSDLSYQDEQVILVVPTQDAPFITVELMRKGDVEVCL